LATNHLREVRENRLISMAELARKAGISALTISRVENGASCRLETKRKSLLPWVLSLWKGRGIS
jgi:DNA-binding XRE family transcriptional regulator